MSPSAVSATPRIVVWTPFSPPDNNSAPAGRGLAHLHHGHKSNIKLASGKLRDCCRRSSRYTLSSIYARHVTVWRCNARAPRHDGASARLRSLLRQCRECSLERRNRFFTVAAALGRTALYRARPASGLAAPHVRWRRLILIMLVEMAVFAAAKYPP